MNEEKSMVEYKESKGLFQWFKSQFEKLKEKFRPKAEVKKKVDEGPGLTPEQLDVVKGGYPDPSVLDYNELETQINNLEEPKSWELTEEQLAEVKAGYPNVNPEEYQQKEQGLSEEELDKITAGHPIIDNDEYSK